MHARRRTAIVAFACLILTLTVLVAGAAASTLTPTPPAPPPHPPPIQFGVDTAAFTWADIKDGKASIPVWNNTLEPLSMTVSLSPMGFVEAKEPQGALENKDVLLLWPEELPLPGGGQASIPISLIDTVEVPKADEYNGVLHVSVAKLQAVIHLDLEITVTDADLGAGTAPVPLVKEWNLFQYRCPLLGWKWSGKACLDLRNRFLPLDVDGGKDGNVPEIALEDTETLGYLTSPDKGLAKVTYNNKSQLDYGKVAIELAVDGLTSVGDYAGEIDLIPGDPKDKGKVKLTVKVTDHPLYPIVAIVVGVIIAALAKNLTGVRYNLRRLHLRLAKLDSEVKVINGVLQVPGSKGVFQVSDYGVKREAYDTAIAKLREDYWHSTITLGPDVEAYKTVDDDLTAFDGQVRALAVKVKSRSQPAGQTEFEKQLGDLEESLKAITPNMIKANPQLPGPGPKTRTGDPAFKKRAEGLVAGMTLTFDEMVARQADVVKATETAKLFVGWVTRYNAAVDDLNAITLPPQPAKPVQDAIFALSQVHSWLWDLATPKEFEGADVETVLQNAQNLVAGIKGLLHVPPVAVPAAPAAPAKGGIRQVLRRVSTAEAPKWLRALRRWMRRVRVLRGWMRGVGLVMFILQMVVAVTTALATLYFDKSFGTCVDYLKAFTWGLGTVAVLEGVWSALNRLTTPVE